MNRCGGNKNIEHVNYKTMKGIKLFDSRAAAISAAWGIVKAGGKKWYACSIDMQDKGQWYILEKYEDGIIYRQEKDGRQVLVAFPQGTTNKQDVLDEWLRYWKNEAAAQAECDFYSEDCAVGGNWYVVEVEA